MGSTFIYRIATVKEHTHTHNWSKRQKVTPRKICPTKGEHPNTPKQTPKNSGETPPNTEAPLQYYITIDALFFVMFVSAIPLFTS